MSQYSKTSYKALYGSSGTIFPDNTTEEISEGDMRQFGEDQADTFMSINDNAYNMFVATASGTDTYTATLNPSISSYSSDHRYFIKFTNANTGASTLNLNTLGAKSIVKNGSTALAAGNIAAGQILILAYDGTNLQVIGGSSSGSSGISGSLTANRIPYASGASTVTDDSALTWDNSNNVLTVGAPGSAGSAEVAVSGNGGLVSTFSGSQYGASASAASLYLRKSRNTTVGSHTILQDLDAIGDIFFQASDGSSFLNAAYIRARVSGTPGTNDMPTQLEFATTADGSGGATPRLVLTSDGRLYGLALHGNAGSISGTTNHYIASGAYNPTLTSVLNVAASNSFGAQFMRVGRVVTVSGAIEVNATAAGATQIGISLPIASNFGAAYIASGTASSGTIHGRIDADTVNDRAQFTYVATASGAVTYFYHYTYQID